jgi:hypothetical protein
MGEDDGSDGVSGMECVTALAEYNDTGEANIPALRSA